LNDDDRLDTALRVAIREEAYRSPVTLQADTVRERIARGAGRTSRAVAWLAGAAAAVVICAVVTLGLPNLPGFGPDARPPSARSGTAYPCPMSSETRHGSWWVEVGGPAAFFNIEPGTRRPTLEDETWLLIVRFDPDARPGQSLGVRARRLDSDDGVGFGGSYNSPVDPTNLFHLDEPAPALPGGWYLFEQRVRDPGCWRLEALIDGVVVGSAVVQVSLDDGRPREVPPGASPGAPGPLSP